MKHRFRSIPIAFLALSSSNVILAQTANDRAHPQQTPAAPVASAVLPAGKPTAAPTASAAKDAASQPQSTAAPTEPQTAGASTEAATASSTSTSASEPPPKTDEVAALKEELKALHKQVDQLSAEAATQTDISGVQTDAENFKYQYQRDRETKSATSTRNLLIGGLVQTRFGWFSENITTPVNPAYQNTSVNNPVLLRNRHTTFDIPNAILSFSGLLYRDYEAARNLQFQLSAAASPATSNAGLGANNVNSFFTVLDANITYQVLPTIENDGDRLSFKLGQFLVPFGLEANTTEELRPVINNAQFVAATGFNLRNIGAVAHGEFFAQYDFGYNYRQALIAFDLGIVNGNGPNRDDDNEHKDIFGRIAITIPASYDSWLRELRIGASGYLGETNLVLTTPAGGTTPADGGYAGAGKRNRLGVDVYYNHFPFGVTYEHVWLADDVLVNNAESRRNGRADTATVFYSFGEQFLNSIKNQGKFDDWWPKTYQPFIRYDRYDPNVDVGDNHIELYTAGLNIFFAETTKFQLNATRRIQHTAPNQSTPSGEALAQFQFGF